MHYFDFSDIRACFKWIFKNEIDKFEADFARYLGIRYTIGTSFGRTALYLGLKAVDVKDREVIIPAFTCTVVRNAVKLAGAEPVFVDINFKNFDFNIKDLKKKISAKTKVIVLTHYFGRVASNIEEVLSIAKANNIILVEDCAHSLGAEYRSKKVGTYGDFSIFSLTKNTLNFGGGILATDNRDIFRKAREFLAGEKKSFRKKFVDFPLIVSYGFEQYINKVLMDRIAKFQFRRFLMGVPHFFIRLRQKTILLLKYFTIPRKSKSNLTPRIAAGQTPKRDQIPYNRGLGIEPIVASLGLTQLKKIELLNKKRHKLSKQLATINYPHFNEDTSKSESKDVHTYFIFNFPDHNIFKLIKKYKKRGLVLWPTWPTHQRIWNNQDTDNLRKIEYQILTWTINPDVKYAEIQKFYQILGKHTDLYMEKMDCKFENKHELIEE